MRLTLPETNGFGPEKWMVGRRIFVLGWPIFRGYVSFREGNFLFKNKGTYIIYWWLVFFTAESFYDDTYMVLVWWILQTLVGRGVVPWFWNCIFSPPVADRHRWGAVLSSVLELKTTWFPDLAMFSHVSVVFEPEKKSAREITVLHSIT